MVCLQNPWNLSFVFNLRQFYFGKTEKIELFLLLSVRFLLLFKGELWNWSYDFLRFNFHSYFTLKITMMNSQRYQITKSLVVLFIFDVAFILYLSMWPSASFLHSIMLVIDFRLVLCTLGKSLANRVKRRISELIWK